MRHGTRPAPTSTPARSASICGMVAGPTLRPAPAVAMSSRSQPIWLACPKSRRPSSWRRWSVWRHTMPDTMMMFEPLSIEKRAGTAAAERSADKTPIIPVPPDAPPMRFRHPKYGYPTAEYAYHVATGELAGYACRFDFTDEHGKADKDVLPITFCD